MVVKSSPDESEHSLERRLGQVPSPPLAVHDRGSQGASGVTVEVGGANALLPDGDVVDAVVGGNVVVDPALAPAAPPAADVDVVVDGGGLTLKSVPVTTVTCDPALTWLGLSAMITAPVMELATACAAASSAGLLEE